MPALPALTELCFGCGICAISGGGASPPWGIAQPKLSSVHSLDNCQADHKQQQQQQAGLQSLQVHEAYHTCGTGRLGSDDHACSTAHAAHLQSDFRSTPASSTSSRAWQLFWPGTDDTAQTLLTCSALSLRRLWLCTPYGLPTNFVTILQQMTGARANPLQSTSCGVCPYPECALKPPFYPPPATPRDAPPALSPPSPTR